MVLPQRQPRVWVVHPLTERCGSIAILIVLLFLVDGVRKMRIEFRARRQRHWPLEVHTLEVTHAETSSPRIFLFPVFMITLSLLVEVDNNAASCRARCFSLQDAAMDSIQDLISVERASVSRGALQRKCVKNLCFIKSFSQLFISFHPCISQYPSTRLLGLTSA